MHKTGNNYIVNFGQKQAYFEVIHRTILYRNLAESNARNTHYYQTNFGTIVYKIYYMSKLNYVL